MKYLRVRWRHDHATEPIELWSELDDAGMETRKIEVFRDGARQVAPSPQRSSSTRLGESAIPEIDEINQDPQFAAEAITAGDFERAWEGCRRGDDGG